MARRKVIESEAAFPVLPVLGGAEGEYRVLDDGEQTVLDTADARLVMDPIYFWLGDDTGDLFTDDEGDPFIGL